MNLKLLYAMFLMPCLVIAQHLEMSFKLYNYLGLYGTIEISSESENQLTKQRVNSYIIGLRSRVVLDNHMYLDFEIQKLFGGAEYQNEVEGIITSKVKFSPQSSNIIAGGIGKYARIDKLRISPTFIFGASYTKSGKVIS